MKKLVVLCFGMILAACTNHERPKPNISSILDEGSEKNLDLRVANWKGERVVLMGNPPVGLESTYKNIGSEPLAPGTPWGSERDVFRFGKPMQGLPNVKYAGKTGVVSDVTEQGLLGTYVVTLDDTREKVIVRDLKYLASLSMMQKIKKSIETLEGRALWTRGTLRLLQQGDAGDSISKDKKVLEILPLSKATVSRVDLGVRGAQIVVYFKTEDGQEGGLYFGSDSVNKHYHTVGSPCLGGSNIQNYFYLKSPSELFPTWTAETRNHVSKGEFAVGMTEEMVSATCGPYLYKVSITATANTLETIYRCCEKQFLIDNETRKITRLVD
jgi:hypothetical protein